MLTQSVGELQHCVALSLMPRMSVKGTSPRVPARGRGLRGASDGAIFSRVAAVALPSLLRSSQPPWGVWPRGVAARSAGSHGQPREGCGPRVPRRRRGGHSPPARPEGWQSSIGCDGSEQGVMSRRFVAQWRYGERPRRDAHVRDLGRPRTGSRNRPRCYNINGHLGEGNASVTAPP